MKQVFKPYTSNYLPSMHTFSLSTLSKHLSTLFFGIISLCYFQITIAQTLVTEGTYDLQFKEYTQGCGSGNTDYCVQLQIKSTSDVESFSIGSYTFYFTYNQDAINNPVYQVFNFGNNGTCASGSPAYMTPAFFADTFTGEANVTTIMELPNQGCPVVSTQWVSIGLVCFDVVDDTETTQLAFGTDFTEVNKNDDTPRHNQGTFSELDEIPIITNIPANVDLAPEAPTTAAICSDEAYNLIADVSTLSFGLQVGDNPIVAWVISTTDPEDASPLLAEGYTEQFLPGSPTTTAATIGGTNEGLDPFGLNVSTIWVSPITTINYDESEALLEIDFTCFDWGEAVEITFLADNTGDCPSTCTANVDLSDQIGQEIGICSDENVDLLADVNTLDFGENAGDNPVVGWGILTDVPTGDLPFDDPNYTGSTIAGDPETTSITIGGTNDGLDPFGFNASTLYFVPITFINYDPSASPALIFDGDCLDWGQAVAVNFQADGFSDCPPPCEANVEVANGIELEVSLCVEEFHVLRVNEMSLNFGIEVGTNPTVGWVISTTDPGELSPFVAEGFTGFAIPGNDGDENIIVNGTSEGTDPYGVGVSTLWFTPVTYFNYDEDNNSFDLNDNCFDWGESVQVTFVANGEGDCIPEPQCPTTTGDFSNAEDLCSGDRPTVPSDEEILNSLDDSSNAVINWSMDPVAPLVYDGDGCEPQIVEIILTITCSQDETVNIVAGGFTISLYPTPQAPTVVFADAELCSYTVVPNCPNDAVLPDEVENQMPGTSGIVQTFTVSNAGCTALVFENIAIPDCEEIPPQCPSTVGDFTDSQNICNVGFASVPSDATILASLDDATNAIVEWSVDPTAPINYEGDGCEPQRIDFELTIRCSDNENIALNGGIHTVFVYPNPQAPTVNLISATETCRYELIPSCENDILEPNIIEDQVAGTNELIQIIKVSNAVCTGLNFFNVTIPACPAICPSSAGTFDTSENLCDGDTPTLTDDATILATVDLPEGARVNWSPDPTDPLVYNGDGCNPEAVIFSLTIGCQVDGSIAIPAGSHVVNLYPNPQPPIIELTDNTEGNCTYALVLGCEDDIAQAETIPPMPVNETVLISVSNVNGCEVVFPEVVVPDCLIDDIDPIQFPNQLQMEITPNFLQSSAMSHIEVYLPQSSGAVLEVLDISGRKVAQVQKGRLAAGIHSFEWMPENLTSGLYLVHLQTEYGHEVRKVLIGE